MKKVTEPGDYAINSVFIDSRERAVQKVDHNMFVWTDGDWADEAGIRADIERGDYSLRLAYDAGTARGNARPEEASE